MTGCAQISMQIRRKVLSQSLAGVVFLMLAFSSALAGSMSAHAFQLCAGRLASEEKYESIPWPNDMPTLGNWMLDQAGSPAHWLGETVGGKALREPINVIIIDTLATAADAAKSRIMLALRRAGYPIRIGHSTGYGALIDGKRYTELPPGREDAFSNRPFEESNNHGRIFGPYEGDGGYIFIGAFSRELVSIRHDPVHRYDSFNKARDDLAARLDARSGFKIVGYIDMNNAVRDDPSITTGDHDGKAVLLCARY
jgi:hypothetical protein